MNPNKGDSAYIAAVAERLKSQGASMQAMMDDMNALMERVSSAKPSQGIEQMLSAIESTMAEIADGMSGERMAKAIEALGAAIERSAPTINIPKQATPAVTVNVNPTPITVEAVMPRQAAPVVNFTPPDMKNATWEVRIPGQYGANDRVMTITRTQ